MILFGTNPYNDKKNGPNQYKYRLSTDSQRRQPNDFSNSTTITVYNVHSHKLIRNSKEFH